MRKTPLLLAVLCAMASTASAKPPFDTHRLGMLLAAKLHARHAQPRPQSLDNTDFSGTNLGCITLRRGEMRGLGYPGHAFLCEEDLSGNGEVLGAVLNRSGRAICYITGNDAGDACYDLTICDTADTLCVR